MQNPVKARTAPRLSRCWGLRWFGLGLLLLGLTLSTGCHGGSGATANSVSGKVTLGGQPVSGIIAFVYASGPEASAPINSDGTYTIFNPQPGQVKIVVRPMPGGVGAPAGGPEMPKMPGMTQAQTVPPPAKYSQAASSDLSYEVKAGKQTYDVTLTP